MLAGAAEELENTYSVACERAEGARAIFSFFLYTDLQRIFDLEGLYALLLARSSNNRDVLDSYWLSKD